LNEAKARYATIFKAYVEEVKALNAAHQSATADLRAKIDAKYAERENCPNVRCAQDLSQVIDQLEKVYNSEVAKLNDRLDDTEVRTATEGIDLALNAFAKELELAFGNEISAGKVKILHSSLVNNCDFVGKQFKARFRGPNNSQSATHRCEMPSVESCKTAIFEYRLTDDAYGEHSRFGRVYFTLAMSDDTSPQDLFKLFKQSRDGFLFFSKPYAPPNLSYELFMRSLNEDYTVGTLLPSASSTPVTWIQPSSDQVYWGSRLDILD
jgi:hypothetical protein